MLLWSGLAWGRHFWTAAGNVAMAASCTACAWQQDGQRHTQRRDTADRKGHRPTVTRKDVTPYRGLVVCLALRIWGRGGASARLCWCRLSVSCVECRVVRSPGAGRSRECIEMLQLNFKDVSKILVAVRHTSTVGARAEARRGARREHTVSTVLGRCCHAMCTARCARGGGAAHSSRYARVYRHMQQHTPHALWIVHEDEFHLSSFNPPSRRCRQGHCQTDEAHPQRHLHRLDPANACAWHAVFFSEARSQTLQFLASATQQPRWTPKQIR